MCIGLYTTYFHILMWIFDSGLVYLFRPFFEGCSLYSFCEHTLSHLHLHIWWIRLCMPEVGRSVGGCFSQQGLGRVEMDDGSWGFLAVNEGLCAAKKWAGLCCQVLGGLAELGAVLVCQNSLVLAADLLPELGCSGSAVPQLGQWCCQFFRVNGTDMG